MSTGPKYSRLNVSDVLSDSPVIMLYGPVALSCSWVFNRAMMLGAMVDEPNADA